MNGKFVGILIILFSFLFSQPLTVKSAEWMPVGSNRQSNISGLALIESSSERNILLAVHDNKKKKQKRAGIITLENGKSAQYAPLDWIGGELPVDLEAVTTIPGTPENFIALSSAGKLYHLQLDVSGRAVKSVKTFDLPAIAPASNFEGFAVQKIGDDLIAVWGERGENTKSGTLFWSRFDPKNYSFGKVGSASLKFSYPADADVRHISDIKIVPDGRVFVSAAADPGNDGPFSSAVYLCGKLIISDSAPLAFEQMPVQTQIYTEKSRKIEALEILSGKEETFVLGTDDENLGSAVRAGFEH